MTWVTVGLLLLAVATAVAIAFVALRGRARRTFIFVPATVALAVAAAVFMQAFVTPRVLESWAGKRAREELLAVPVYSVLEQYEPAVFEKLLAEYRRVVLDRSRLDSFTGAANELISTAATRHIAHASDAALLALMHDMLLKLQTLRAKSPDDCYRYLFPKVSGPPDFERYFDRGSQQRTLGLMADVILTSAEDPVPMPPPDRVQGLLGPIVDAMYGEYGESTQVLSRAEEPGADRRVVCTVSVALYEKVMRLPPADSAAVIRSMTQL
jgi:hypothetical protein